jgi:hypothetical protein
MSPFGDFSKRKRKRKITGNIAITIMKQAYLKSPYKCFP